jgi:peroxiredoxin
VSDATRDLGKARLLAGVILLTFAAARDATTATKDPAVYAGTAGTAGAHGRAPQPMVGLDGSVTRSTLDPLAVVAVGQPAPDFTTSDSQGRFFRLVQLREKTEAVLVFCPSSGGAPACAARLASLQAARATLGSLGARVYVVSERGGAEPAKVRRAAGPSIEWLADPGLRISACYARHAAGEFAPPRAMVVIVDKKGKVVRALDDPHGTQPPTADLLKSIGPATTLR